MTKWLNGGKMGKQTLFARNAHQMEIDRTDHERPNLSDKCSNVGCVELIIIDNEHGEIKKIFY